VIEKKNLSLTEKAGRGISLAPVLVSSGVC